MGNNQVIEQEMKNVSQIYERILTLLDGALIGQADVKKLVTAALLCDTNSKVLFTGNTGMGKTSLVNFLASSFNASRISITADMLPMDIQEQLKENLNLNFLQIDEFNRASGKLQSALLELLAEKQITINGNKYSFNDFYVFATQNSADISGVYSVPQAVYDRFDINVSFDDLTMEDKEKIIFSDFEVAKQSYITISDLMMTKRAVNNFVPSEKDKELLMRCFALIDNLKLEGQALFAGSNIRAHKFALKLAKLVAMASGRHYILSSDFAFFIPSLYTHRINQNLAEITDEDVKDTLDKAQRQVLELKKIK